MTKRKATKTKTTKITPTKPTKVNPYAPYTREQYPEANSKNIWNTLPNPFMRG